MAADKRTRRNREITSREVRVIDDKGENHGVLGLSEALELAQQAGLDLVEVSPNVDPPVCRIMDYGKFAFERSKANANSKKKARKTQLKEIKFRPGTDIGDYNIKLRKLREFLEIGDKTKITVRFRGREMAHQELGKELIDRIVADLEDISQVEQYPNMEGRQMVMVLAPQKKTN